MKFQLDDDERKRLDEWDSKHLDDHHEGEEPYCGAIGGRVTFTLTSTGLGLILGVECGVCRAKGKPREVYRETLTDLSEW